MDRGTSHPSDAEIERFHRQQLDEAALVIFADHLAACETCRARASRMHEDASDLLDGFDTLADHVSEDELHAYVGRTLPLERTRAVENHLVSCPRCAAEAGDLRALAVEDESRRSRRFLAYGILATAAVLMLALGATLLRRGAHTHAVLTLADAGRSVTIDDRGSLTGVDGLVDSDRRAVREALQSGTLAISPGIASLAGAAGVLMGSREAPLFEVVSPVATAVRELTPTFRWTAAAGSTGYTITIQDQSDGSTLTSGQINATRWTPERPLAPGHTYRWQAAAAVGSREVVAPSSTDPPASFRVLDRATADSLAGLPPSHAVRVVLYARAGLLDDAHRELDLLASMNPGSPVVRQWQAQLKAARPLARR